jgi:glycosyltransferase involved in cell wall biosynthesis
VSSRAPWTVLCFSGVDWDDNRQRPQWVMTGLADRGAAVLYVDNLGARLPRLSDAPRVARRLGRWIHSSALPGREVYPGIRRDAPVIPPLQHPAPLRWLAQASLVRRLRGRLSDRRPLVVWTYAPLPAIRWVAATLRADVLVYDWSDDASEHLQYATEARRRRMAAWEHRMLERADVVFVASGELLRRRGSTNPRTFVVPHGAPPAAPPATTPSELRAASRPMIGYVGTVGERVDLELIETLARERPSWSFVLVGPIRTRLDHLRRRPNVICTGRRPHEEVAAFLDSFDVALIPYRVTPATAVASPIKLHEYLAHGLPVISTDLPEVRALSPPARIVAGPEAFLDAIEDALVPGRPRPPRGATWDERVEEMILRVSEALSVPRPWATGSPRAARGRY